MIALYHTPALPLDLLAHTADGWYAVPVMPSGWAKRRRLRSETWCRAAAQPLTALGKLAALCIADLPAEARA